MIPAIVALRRSIRAENVSPDRAAFQPPRESEIRHVLDVRR